MELISIPNVSLVDASGRSIGVYTDDPNWWQQLERQQKEQAQIVKKAIEKESNLEKSNAVENFRALKATIGKDTTNLLSHMKIELGVLSHAESNGLENPLKKEVHNEHESYQCDVIGETPLHIAIMYNDLTTIKFVVEECGYSVSQRSVNNDFVSGFTNKEAIKSINSSQYDGLAYYGEYPLALAACFSDKDIYDYLLSKGADPNLPDTNGNTVLHVLVINNKLVSSIHYIKQSS
jgi:ankyrin repeat protein